MWLPRALTFFICEEIVTNSFTGDDDLNGLTDLACDGITTVPNNNHTACGK